MIQSILNKSIYVLAIMTLWGALPANAQSMAVELGIRQQSATATASGTENNAKMAYQFGLTGAFPFTEKLALRSGFLYTQRPVVISTGGVETTYEFNYFDIPVTLLWRLNDFGGVYAGVNLGLIASADCDNCGTSVDKKSAVPLVIGGSFKFAPNFGINVYYEALNKFNDDFKEGRAVGANLLITFD